MSSTLPRVSVLVLNLNGRQHLDPCLASLEAQTYHRDRFDVVVVDNGSADGSISFVRQKYPRTRVIGFETNRGFCAPYNAAVKASDADFVALLNNDTRVEPDWLVELVSAAERHQAAAVASKILNWTGDAIDFVGGATSFIGHAWQLDLKEPATRTYSERPLLFPCAGSALFSRAAFLDAGGFDEDFFAYFEDVDLGWRLNLFGERVVLAPKAVTYHQMHGTSSKWAFAQRVRLLERNALAIIYKNYETATLERVLPAAIALFLLRASTNTGIDKLTLGLSQQAPEVVDTHPYLAAHLIALEDFCQQLPELKRKRAVVQKRRRRSDAELLELFGDPWRLHETGGVYEDVARWFIRELGIAEALGSTITRPSTRVATKAAGSADSHDGPGPGRQLVPKVSIVILTALGATHLPECLDSLRKQTYPADSLEVVIVDNGSADDPTPEVRARFPAARIIRNETNLGFAAGNNRGAAEATGDYLVFLNDDTRADPDWLAELVATAQRRRAAAVASRILDWSGSAIDFVEGAVNFEGKGFQLHYGAPTHSVHPEENRLLFACGCAMLVDRAVFNEAGGWDEETFAYYEDVELGWRLHVLGLDVWSSPKAVVYHKHHGTSGRWPEPPRQRLYERNALRILFRLLEPDSLARALPAALLLAADRALLASGLSRVADTTPQSAVRRFMAAGRAALRARGITRSMPSTQKFGRLRTGGFLRFARDVQRLSAAQHSRSRRDAYLMERGGMPAIWDAHAQPMPIDAAAMLSGIYSFLTEIPQMAERRAEFQRRRRVKDHAIISQFGSHWLAASGSRFQAEHQALHSAIAEEFELAALARPPVGAGST